VVVHCLALRSSSGFNYRFDALNPHENKNELNDAFATMFRAGENLTLLPILQAWFPIFRAIVRVFGFLDKARA
jgi:hypothetical protein